MEPLRHRLQWPRTCPICQALVAAEISLHAQGLSGWLAVTDGMYHGRGRLEVLMVRAAATPPADGWDALMETRAAANRAERASRAAI